jgi:hypothetical protein
VKVTPKLLPRKKANRMLLWRLTIRKKGQRTTPQKVPNVLKGNTRIVLTKELLPLYGTIREKRICWLSP